MPSHSGLCEEIPANDGMFQTLADPGRDISEELVDQGRADDSVLKVFTTEAGLRVWIPRIMEWCGVLPIIPSSEGGDRESPVQTD